jgi:hypothetical protein
VCFQQRVQTRKQTKKTSGLIKNNMALFVLPLPLPLARILFVAFLGVA